SVLNVTTALFPPQLEGVGERLDLEVAQGVDHAEERDRTLLVRLREHPDVGRPRVVERPVLEAPVGAGGEQPGGLELLQIVRQLGPLPPALGVAGEREQLLGSVDRRHRRLQETAEFVRKSGIVQDLRPSTAYWRAEAVAAAPARFTAESNVESPALEEDRRSPRRCGRGHN